MTPSRSETDPALRALAALHYEAQDEEPRPAMYWHGWHGAIDAALAAAEAAPLDVAEVERTLDVILPPWMAGQALGVMAQAFVNEYGAALRSPDTETAGEAG